jgi:hypothetical protein
MTWKESGELTMGTTPEQNAWDWLLEAFRTAEHTIVTGLFSLLGISVLTLRHLFSRLSVVEGKVSALESQQVHLASDIVNRLDRVEARQDRMLEILARSVPSAAP